MRRVVRVLAMASVVLVSAVGCGVDGGGPDTAAPAEHADSATTEEPTTTTEEPTTTTRPPTTTTEAPTTTAAAAVLSPEDEAACRFMLDETAKPGDYDPAALFPQMADMATDGGEVEAAANNALTTFQQSGDVQDAVVDLLTACMPVIGQ